VVDFGYGRGNVAAFPRAAWLRSVRRVLTEAADERLGYLDGHGAVELRSALAAYLNRVRGPMPILRRSSSPAATRRRCRC
jgi:GntR family transcriptional regulator/MocR family aminotransferase